MTCQQSYFYFSFSSCGCSLTRSKKRSELNLKTKPFFIFLKLNVVVVSLLAIRGAWEWWKNFARLVRSWGELESDCGIHQLIVTPSSGSIISWTPDLKHQFYTFMTSSSSSLFSINSHDRLHKLRSKLIFVWGRTQHHLSSRRCDDKYFSFEWWSSRRYFSAEITI